VAADDATVDLAVEIQQARVAAKGCAHGEDVLGGLRSKPTNGHERHADSADGATTLVLRVQERGARIRDVKPVTARVHTPRQQQYTKPARVFDRRAKTISSRKSVRIDFLLSRVPPPSSRPHRSAAVAPRGPQPRRLRQA